MTTPIGSFVPTSNVWDISRIQQIDVNSSEFKELLIRLYQNINLISINLNLKDIGYYNTMEFNCGQQYFPNPTLNTQTTNRSVYRSVLRMTINFGALPNAGSKSVAHGIPVNSAYTFTRIYGAASDTTGMHYVPIPYTSNSGATNMIQIDVDSTDVTINTGTVNRSNFNVCYIVLEYIVN